jgi:hypothetical protein
MKHLFLFISTFMVMQTQAQLIPPLREQTNDHFSHTDSTIASSDKIWQIWIDVANWKQWDKGLKEASVNGEFMVGTTGKLIPEKGPKSKFVISELVPNKSYTFKTKIPFGWLIIKRTLEVKEGKTFFTHDVQFTGFLKKILGNKLGKNYRAMLPSVLSEIKQIAERK